MDFTGRIVVGYDGSAESTRALRWAAQLAQQSSTPLAIVHAWAIGLVTKDHAPIEGVADSGHRNAVLRLLREGVAEAEEAAPGVELTTGYVPGSPRAVLETASDTADLIVVGSRGLGGFLGMLLGSVGLGLVTHAGCPVIVVREDEAPHGPVVIGADGSENSLLAVDHGVDLARALGAPVRIVSVHSEAGDVRGAEQADAILEAARERAVARAMQAGASERELDIATESIAARNSVRGLLGESQRAGILVLGPHDDADRRFGSTAHSLVHHSACTTVICRRHRIAEGPGAEAIGQATKLGEDELRG